MRLTISYFIPIILGIIEISNFIDGRRYAPEYSACGGKLFGPRGIIHYKKYTSVEDECVWTISHHNTASFSLHYDATNINSMSYTNGLTVVCVFPTGNMSVSLEQHRLVGNSFVRLGANCPMFVLTFYTGSFGQFSDSKGFTLSWFRVFSGYSSNSKKYVTTVRDLAVIRHPGWGKMYSNNELSIFSFVPQNNVYNSEQWSLVTLIPEGDTSGAHCDDSIFAFKLQANGTYTRVESPTGLGSSVCKPRVWLSKDVLMLVFKSDAANVGNGFKLLHYGKEC